MLSGGGVGWFCCSGESAALPWRAEAGYGGDNS